MSEAPTRRVLVIANLTESTPRLLEEVERRARSGCDFTLAVPPERHPDAPDWTPEEGLELVRRAAAGRHVELVDCGADAAATIGDLVEQGACDEIVLSTPPEHHPHWHRHGLPKQIQALGRLGDRHPARSHRLVLLAWLPGRVGAHGDLAAHVGVRP